MNSTLAYIFLMINIIFTVSSSNALTFKLIHRDSPQSPLFQPNLSNLQSYLREIKTSKTRVSYLKSLTNLETKFHKTIFKRSLSVTSSFFTINLPVGVPETKTALVFDITSPLTWMQCKPCKQCFKQKLPIFDPYKSQTFRRMYRKHTQLAKLFNCTDYECTYDVDTRSILSSIGSVSIEKFKYISKDLVFGCGTRNDLVFHPTETGVTGVLGMANFNTSFIRQLADNRDDARFSYCLSSSWRKRSILKIGGDDLISNERHNVQTTKFLRGPIRGKSLRGGEYRLKLIGISVAGKRLDIPINFEYSGCIVDTVSPVSALDVWAYQNVMNAISGYFARFKNVKRLMHKKYWDKLCFKYPRGFSDFPGMVWHFEGANLEVNGTNLFLFGNDLFGSRFVCLQLLGHSKTNILGVYQQRNVRFLFDLENEELSFVQKSC